MNTTTNASPAQASANTTTCQLCNRRDYKATPFYYRWDNKEFKLVKCRNCGLITLDPKPTPEELVKLYSEDYFEHGAHGLNQVGATYEANADRLSIENRKSYLQRNILQYEPNVKSLFEIGYAMGHLLVAARDMGMKVSGLEFSDYAAQRAKEKFDLDLLSGDFETKDLSAEYNQWDCVFGGDVFEHFANPDPVAAKISKLLKPGGVAVLYIPSTFNLFSTKLAVLVYGLTGKRKKMYDNPYHLYEYTTGTLHKLLAKHFSRVVIVNNIKKPSELNMKTKTLEYRLKRAVHYVNYPFTKLFNRNGDRLLVLAYK
jgi:2-polyprenyl-3-methyl-5-hydroxy-6-metoxy-1,4-benzoquinol methylase